MAGLLDRAGVACATTSTGTLTLGAALGAVAPNLASFQDFNAAGAVDGKVYRYLILDSNGAWERGKGTYTASGTTLTRTVRFSSNSNNAINLSGNAQVFVSPDENDMVSISTDQTSVFTASERGQGRVNLGAATIAAMAALLLNPNSGMEVSQENGTASVTLTASGVLQTKYLVDGVMAAYRGTFVASGQQVTDAPTGYRNSLKFTVGTAESSLGANDELSVLIPVEGVRSARLGYGAAGANALAIWFWVKAHRTGNYSGSLRNASKARSYPFSFTVNASDTWEMKSVLVSTGDTSGTWVTDTGVGLYLTVCIAGGSSRVGAANAWASADYSGVTSTTNGVAATSDVFQITGASTLPLVSGATVADVPLATEAAFVIPPFDVEIERSLRYWEKSYQYSDAPGTVTTTGERWWFLNDLSSAAINVVTNVYFRRKRVPPTVTSYSPGSGASGKVRDDSGTDRTPLINNISETSCTIDATQPNPDTRVSLTWHWVADARLP